MKQLAETTYESAKKQTPFLDPIEPVHYQITDKN